MMHYFVAWLQERRDQTEQITAAAVTLNSGIALRSEPIHQTIKPFYDILLLLEGDGHRFARVREIPAALP